MRCSCCRPVPRRDVGGLLAPLSVAAAPGRACRGEPLMPVREMEARELGEQGLLRLGQICHDLGACCMHLVGRDKAVLKAHKNLLLYWVLRHACNPRGHW